MRIVESKVAKDPGRNWERAGHVANALVWSELIPGTLLDIFNNNYTPLTTESVAQMAHSPLLAPALIAALASPVIFGTGALAAYAKARSKRDSAQVSDVFRRELVDKNERMNERGKAIFQGGLAAFLSLGAANFFLHPQPLSQVFWGAFDTVGAAIWGAYAGDAVDNAKNLTRRINYNRSYQTR